MCAPISPASGTTSASSSASQRQVGQLSLRKLSELAGISNPYLSQIERGLRKPSAEILQQIARALRISAETLYVRAGILEDRDDDARPSVDAIRRDPHLTEEQKQTLVRDLPVASVATSDGRHAARPPRGEHADDVDRRPAPSRRDRPSAALTRPCAGWPSSRCTRRRWSSRARATAAA